MKNSGEVESASKKKRPSKSQLEAQAAETAAARDAAEKQAAELHSKVLELSARAADGEGRTAETAREAEKARQEAGEAKARAAELEGHIAELSSQAARVAPLEKEAAALGAQLEAARREAGEAKARIVELEKEAAAQASQLEEARREAAELRQARDAGQKECELLRAKASDLEEWARREVGEEKVRIVEFERRIGELSSQAARVAPLEEEAAAVSFQLEESRRELEEAKARTAGLDRRILELSAEAGHFASLEKEVLALGGQLEESRRELEEARRRAGEEERRLKADLEAAENEHRAKATVLEEQARRASAALEGQLEETEAKARGEAAALREAAERRGEEVKRLEGELARAQESEAKARALASDTAALREAAERRGEEVKRLEGQVSELERKLRDVASLLKPSPEPAAPEREPEVSPAPAAAAPAPVPPEPAPAAPPPPAAPAPAAAPVAPAPAESTQVRSRPIELAEAILEPRNFFGPAGEDGRPVHVLLELLARDALGLVYRACERATGQHFAVRFMPGQAGEEQSRAIEQEVELLMALPHPNILAVRGSGRRQSRLYITMDLVRAPSIGEAKVREIPRICAIFRDAAEAVHYAHEEGILHGDLNPDNILVAKEEGRDHALVKDFGLGHLLEGLGPKAPGKESAAIRAPAYLPPEQMKEMKGKLSVAADVYGLGATLYAALAGRPPFEGKDARQVTTRVLMEEPAPLERVRPDVPESLAAVVRRAMAKERNLRYPTALELAQALTRFLEGPGTRIRFKPPAPEERKE